jgi:zinc D-Ala-D-Ala carboxypeptidase
VKKTIFFLLFTGVISSATAIVIQSSDLNNQQRFYAQKVWDDQDVDAYANYKSISEKISEANMEKSVDLEIENRENTHYTYFQNQKYLDENFLGDATYLIPGEAGKYTSSYTFVRYSDERISKTKKINFRSVKTLEATGQKTFSGGKSKAEARNIISSSFSELIKSLSTKDKNLFKKYSINSELEIQSVDQTTTTNIQLTRVTFSTAKNFVAENTYFRIGSAESYFKNCNRLVSVSLWYNSELQAYQIGDVQNIINNLCSAKSDFNNENLEIGNCSDCTLYPVDKKHGLNSSYEPEVQLVQEIPGGQYFLKNAMKDLLSLNEAALAAGLKMEITSGYRSFNTQVNTFEYWVQYEMSQGKDRKVAELNANSYSARPGFSEHQLGTALDINAAGCNSFSGVCASNDQLWNWLKNNAYLYGFALSYPSDKTALTGYIYEPWHYRWIGRELAQEYKTLEGKTYLAEFLYQKGLY